VLKHAEVIVVGHADAQVRQVIARHAPGKRIVDLSGYADLREIAGAGYEGICW
jgi:GDP-mannose 6-dehydrogenase